MTEEVENWMSEFFDLNPDAVKEEEIKAKKKASTLTLAMELPAMDNRDMNFYKNLSEEHKKEISLWVLMRYMSSSQSAAEHHIIMVNDLVNHNFSNLSKHPELQWKLLALCGTKKKQYHPWIAPPRGIKKNKLEQAILDIKPMKNSDLELWMSINNNKEVLSEFFRDNGWDDKAIKDLLKDVK